MQAAKREVCATYRRYTDIGIDENNTFQLNFFWVNQ